MENGDICKADTVIFVNHPYNTLACFLSCNSVETHTSAVGVDDVDSQRAVLHVALEVQHGALTRRHRSHVAQLSCEKEQ